MNTVSHVPVRNTGLLYAAGRVGVVALRTFGVLFLAALDADRFVFFTLSAIELTSSATGYPG